MSCAIFPSLIDANLLLLAQSIKQLEPWCDGFHLDIMDNHFVPNLTWGPMFVNAIGAQAKKPLEIHLMVDDPLGVSERCLLRPNDLVIFHSEQRFDQKQFIERLHDRCLRAGIAIGPETKVTIDSSLLSMIDTLVLMAVKPGFSGQQFLDSTWEKLSALVALRQQQHLLFKIHVDGGVNEHNIKQLAQQGCDGVAIASAIFSHDDPVEALKKLTDKVRS